MRWFAIPLVIASDLYLAQATGGHWVVIATNYRCQDSNVKWLSNGNLAQCQAETRADSACSNVVHSEWFPGDLDKQCRCVKTGFSCDEYSVSDAGRIFEWFDWGCNTAGGAGCASCVEQSLRSSDTTCSTCNSGYYESSGACQAWGCSTGAGAGCATCAEQSLRSSATTCATCNSGYFESSGACVTWGCNTAGGAGCASCVEQSLRSSHWTCLTCNSGYYESSGACSAWGCITAGGAGCATCFEQSLRSSHATCATCNSGYFAVAGACLAWGCNTAGGAGCASCVEQSLRSSDTTCSSCNSGYYESVGACYESGFSSESGGTTTTPTTTIATTTATTLTGTTLASGLVECAVTMDMTNVDYFLEDTEMETIVQEAMGALLGVIASWIQNIRCVRLRRLALQDFLDSIRAGSSNRRGLASDFDLTTSGGVRIEFDVVIPPDGGPGAVTASLIMEKFDQKSIEEASEIVNKVLKSGALGSKDYSVAISVKKGKITQERHTTEAPTRSDDEFPVMFLAIAVMGGSVCLLITFLFIMCRLRKIRRKLAAIEERISFKIAFDENAFLGEEQLLNPPDSISADAKQQVLKNISGITNVSAPMVFVCSAGGGLDEDLDGRGLFYAAAVVQALTLNGISCYVSLPKAKSIPADVVLCESFPVKLFVLVETREIYSCRNCLNQIYSAQSNDITITRLQFEQWQDVPKKDNQWSNIPYDEIKALEKREVVRSTMLTARLVPDFPDRVQSVPGFLEAYCLDLGRGFNCNLHEPTLLKEPIGDLSSRVEDEDRISSKSGGESKRAKAMARAETDGAISNRKRETDSRDGRAHDSDHARRKKDKYELKHAMSNSSSGKGSLSEQMSKKDSRARSDRSDSKDSRMRSERSGSKESKGRSERSETSRSFSEKESKDSRARSERSMHRSASARPSSEKDSRARGERKEKKEKRSSSEKPEKKREKSKSAS